MSEAPPADAPVRGRRQVELDGLRGIAIILVVLSHGWVIWLEISEDLASNRFAGSLFTSGNFAVSIFFVVGAYLYTRSLLRARDSPRGLEPLTHFLRRFVRLTGQVALLMVVVLVATALDGSDTYRDTDTGTSVFRILTYTWNWYLQSNPLDARPDLGNLWYLSVDMQVFVLVLAVVYLLRRNPGVLPVVLAGLLLVSVVWEFHVHDLEGDYQALLRTTARMNAPLTGALVASLLAYAGRVRPFAGVLTAVGLVALVPVLYLTDTNAAYLGWPGQLLNLVLAAFVVGVALAPAPRPVTAVLGIAPLAFLGRHSLSIFIWHYPLFFFLSRHTPDWNWALRTVVALALLLAFSLASERLAESRVQALLASPAWQSLEQGLPALARSGARSLWERRPGSKV